MNPYDIAQIFAQMEQDLIDSMKRNLARHEAEEKKMGFTWGQWQKRKLQALVRYRTENRKLINKAGKTIDQETRSLIEDAFLQGGKKVDGTIYRLWKSLQSFLLAGRLTKPFTQVDRTDNSFFTANKRRVNTLVKAITKDLTNARHAMLRQSDDVYRQTIFKSQVYLNTGSLSLNQAIDMATKDFLAKGFDCITYKNGTKVNVASYAEMALRTSSQRAVLSGEGARQKEWGIHTIVVPIHANTCDLCLPWQGKVLINDVYAGGKKEDGPYPLLSTAMAAGLFHPHCRHKPGTWIEGVSSLPEPVDEEEARGNYQAEQKQRYMERKVRTYKRLEAGSLDPMNQAQYGTKVQEWQGKLREHLEANPQLRRDYSREKIINGLTAKQRNENLKLIARDSKIKEIRDLIKSDSQPKTLNIGQENKHILGTNEYEQRQVLLKRKEQYGPGYVTVNDEDILELIKKYHGTGEISLNSKGVWDKKEVILNNDKIIGKVIDNRNGNSVDTSVFKIHYSNKGVHIVPDYPSKKEGR